MKPASISLYLPVLLTLLFFSCKETPTNVVQNTNSGFIPDDGEALFILGQANEQHMRDYLSEVRSTPLPAGFAFYTSLSGSKPLEDMSRYITFMRGYPNTMLQLAIWTGERRWGNPGYYLDEIIEGKYDENIITLANACKSLNRPIFIRFGYEFDGQHNAYPPDKYKAAYKHFVDMMRSQNVDNVAYVWHSWGVSPYYGTEDYPEYYPELTTDVTHELWYPGDDYVDWLAVSIFGSGWGNLNTNSSMGYFVQFANDHYKPIMIAESAAIKTGNNRDPNWVIPTNTWFSNVFKFIHQNDAVKAFTYINVDWEADNSTTTWGDTRIQNSVQSAQDYWSNKIGTLIHADENLFDKLGYK